MHWSSLYQSVMNTNAFVLDIRLLMPSHQEVKNWAVENSIRNPWMGSNPRGLFSFSLSRRMNPSWWKMLENETILHNYIHKYQWWHWQNVIALGISILGAWLLKCFDTPKKDQQFLELALDLSKDLLSLINIHEAIGHIENRIITYEFTHYFK